MIVHESLKSNPMTAVKNGYSSTFAVRRLLTPTRMVCYPSARVFFQPLEDGGDEEPPRSLAQFFARRIWRLTPFFQGAKLFVFWLSAPDEHFALGARKPLDDTVPSS
jgi:hypothetical protein